MKKILAIVLAVVMLLPVFAVNVFAADEPASADEIVVFESAEGFSDFDPKEPNAFFGKGSVWGRKDADMFTLSMDEIKALISEGGATFSFVYTGSPVGWCNGGVPVVYFHAFDNPAKCKVTDTADGKKEATLNLDEALKAWEANGKTIDDITDFTVQHGQSDFTLYSAKFTKGEGSGEGEKIVLVENKELAGWKNLFEGDAFNTFKSTIVKEGAKLELTYELTGESGYYNLTFDPKSCDSSVDQTKDKITVYKDKIIAELGSVENISEFILNPWGGTLTASTCTVIDASKNVIESVDVNKDFAGWSANFLGTENTAKIIEALKKDEADAVVLNYTMTKEGDWPGGNFHIAGKRKDINLDKSGKMTLTLDDILAACPANDLSRLNGIFSNCDSAKGSIKYTSVTISVPAGKKKQSDGHLAFVYVTDEYHAVLIGGKFLTMPHQEILGYCPMCHAFIETEEAGDKSVFVLETTGGQDYDGNQVTVADGVVLVDAEGKGNARIATNWVAGGEAWNGIVKALPTEGAWLKITYTGKLNNIIFQTDKTSAPEAFETTAPAVVEEGEQNVAWFNCADIVANSAVALSGDFGGWANFMLNFEGDTTVYGFEIVVPEVVPTAE